VALLNRGTDKGSCLDPYAMKRDRGEWEGGGGRFSHTDRKGSGALNIYALCDEKEEGFIFRWWGASY